MTDEMKALRTMLEKGADADVLREMIGFAAERLMELEVQALTGAGRSLPRRRPGVSAQPHDWRDATATATAIGKLVSVEDGTCQR